MAVVRKRGKVYNNRWNVPLPVPMSLIRLPLVLSFAVFTAAALAAAAPAQAQELPSFRLPSVITQEDVEGLSVDFDEAFATIRNPYLSDTLKLQYQMSLMEKLVTRQAAIDQITASYAAMGVEYEGPPPPRGICAQLPANAPCLAAYPELYPALVSERKSHYDALKKKADAMIAAANAANKQPVEEKHEGETDEAALARQKKEAEARAAKEAAAREAKERKDRFRWTDVTCLSGQCRGVLTKPSDAGYRVTVRPGERLSDGTVVQQISTSGIRVSIKGDVINVRPAPGEAATERDTGESAPLAGIINDAPRQDEPLSPAQAAAAAAITSAATRARENIDPNAMAPETGGRPVPGAGPMGGTATASSRGGGGGSGQTTGESPLGPSGLF